MTNNNKLPRQMKKEENIEWVILNKIFHLKESQKKSRKFIGALTIELIRTELLKCGFNVSNRDVFIRGISNELDLLILKPNVKPIENLLYLPNDILFCFEIKYRGSYGEKAVNDIKNNFDKIKNINDKIECIYLTISESRKYRYRVTPEKLGNKYECFELFTRDMELERALKNKKLKASGDWDKLLEKLKKLKK